MLKTFLIIFVIEVFTVLCRKNYPSYLKITFEPGIFRKIAKTGQLIFGGTHILSYFNEMKNSPYSNIVWKSRALVLKNYYKNFGILNACYKIVFFQCSFLSLCAVSSIIWHFTTEGWKSNNVSFFKDYECSLKIKASLKFRSITNHLKSHEPSEIHFSNVLM